MITYTPDKWVILRITNQKETPIYKVLASWYGGYIHGDSWKLNSGIVKIENNKNHYLFHGFSGSIYHCHKESYGTSSYTYSVFLDIQKQAEKISSTIEILSKEDADKLESSFSI